MSTSRLHLSEEQLKTVITVLKDSLSGEIVLAFGSRVRGDHRQTSDLDLAIESPGGLTIKARAKLEQGFSESSLPVRVVVIDLSRIDETFRQLILDGAVEINY